MLPRRRGTDTACSRTGACKAREAGRSFRRDQLREQSQVSFSGQSVGGVLRDSLVQFTSRNLSSGTRPQTEDNVFGDLTGGQAHMLQPGCGSVGACQGRSGL